MTHRRSVGRSIGSRLGAGLVALAIVAAVATDPSAAQADPDAPSSRQSASAINGVGSTYVGLAMQQWTAEAQVQGLRVNYTPTGSPDGLSRFAGGNVDFAGTEAEFSSLGIGGSVGRGYQYVPSVGGAIAVMYNVEDLSGRKVDYLHLSRSTVAKIFMGEISHWDDPAIQADNTPANLRLPKQPINVVYRSGQSGTTALFYDFIRETEPEIYARWIARNGLPSGRIIDLTNAPNFAPRTQALNGSEQIAQFTASAQGKWSIAYDEFGYAKVYRATSAWIDNSGGKWTLPYAQNISTALEGARLRPDLSQELSGVYANPDPLTYPISAYSYIVTQCRQGRDTCRGPYANDGVGVTLSRWLRYIACEGQVRMADIGYSPLPTNLSQEVVSSVTRMTGESVGTLNRDNCANPRFRGSLGPGAVGPPDPYEGLPSNPGGPGGPSGEGPGEGATDGPGGGVDSDGDGIPDAEDPDAADATSTTAGEESADAGAGRSGDPRAVGGGSTDWRAAEPVAYQRGPSPSSRWPALVLLLVVAIPVLATTAFGWVRRRRA